MLRRHHAREWTFPETNVLDRSRVGATLVQWEQAKFMMPLAITRTVVSISCIVFPGRRFVYLILSLCLRHVDLSYQLKKRFKRGSSTRRDWSLAAWLLGLLLRSSSMQSHRVKAAAVSV